MVSVVDWGSKVRARVGRYILDILRTNEGMTAADIAKRLDDYGGTYHRLTVHQIAPFIKRNLGGMVEGRRDGYNGIYTYRLAPDVAERLAHGEGDI
jgi:hypothetical protein